MRGGWLPVTEDRARWVRRGETLGWYALLIGSASQAAAGAASGGRGAAFGAVFAILAAIVAARRRGWAWLLALYWLTILALSLPFDGAAIVRPTAWVAPAEAALLALAAAAAGSAVIGLRRVLPIAAAMLLLLFGGIHLSQGPAIAALTPAWLPMRSVAPYASGLLQIAAGLWLAVRPSRGPAWTMAAMYLSWLPLIHLPRLLAEPDAGEWRFAAMALALAGALILSTTRSDREEMIR
jgi:uncharacterized membrane protein